MEIKEQEMWLFALEQFLGRKLKKNFDDNELMSLVNKVEQEELGMGYKLRTSMETIEVEQKIGPRTNPTYQYRFSIHGTHTVLYSETCFTRKVAVIKAIGNYCKDRLITQMMEKKKWK